MHPVSFNMCVYVCVRVCNHLHREHPIPSESAPPPSPCSLAAQIPWSVCDHPDPDCWLMLPGAYARSVPCAGGSAASTLTVSCPAPPFCRSSEHIRCLSGAQ